MAYVLADQDAANGSGCCVVTPWIRAGRVSTMLTSGQLERFAKMSVYVTVPPTTGWAGVMYLVRMPAARTGAANPSARKRAKAPAARGRMRRRTGLREPWVFIPDGEVQSVCRLA